MAQAGYVAPPINQMSRQELNIEECGICFEELYVPGNRGPPVEITTCHHRFHRNCLQQVCQRNLLICGCPICRARFNFNDNLEDLSPLVAGRLIALDAEEAAAQAQAARLAVPSRLAPRALNPQLLNYLQANYAFDRISKEFINCFSQIIDDAVAFRNDNNMGVELMAPDEYNRPVRIDVVRNVIRGDPSQINEHKMQIFENFIRFINKITQGYKYNPVYAAELLNILENINAINARLQTAAFVESLYQPDPVVNFALDTNAGLKITAGRPLTYNLLTLLKSGLIGRYYQGPFTGFILQLFTEMVGVFLTNNYTSILNDPRERNYLNLIPLTYTYVTQPIVKPDYRFFIRFFNCFVNFIRQLVAIDFNVAQQLGGKKTKKRRKGRKNKKTKKK